MSQPTWMIFRNTVYHWLSVTAAVDGVPRGDRGPTIESREDFEQFVAELREAADQAFGEPEE